MKKFKVSEILVYYDVPEVFVAKDLVETNYLAMMIDIDDSYKYLSIAISPQKLGLFVSGNLDLLQIFKDPEVREFIILSPGNEDDDLFIIDKVLYEIDDEWLPNEGFYLSTPFSDDSRIINEAVEKDNAIIHLAISDDKDDFGIETDSLGDIVKLYSTLLENSYKKAVNQRKVPDMKSFIVSNNYKLRAFASSAASFNLHLFSESNKDIFGNSMIELGLEKIDEIFKHYDNDDELLSVLRTIKGHAVSSFGKMLTKISSDNLKIKHKWFAPNRKSINIQVIEKSRADSILKIISSTVELSEEIKEFSGYFVQVDILKRTWRLKREEDGKEVHGEATSEQLRGITIETIKYKLVCEERIEEFKVSEKEKISYVFKSVEEIREEK